MSYVKLHKVVSDFAVGIQSVNQAIDNNAAKYDQLDLGHSMGLRGGSGSDAFMSPGQHDDPVIARTVLQFAIDTTLTTPIAYALTSGPLLYDVAERVATGQWRIYVTTPQIIGAKATPRASATADRACSARVVADIGSPYVVVTTWNIAGAAPADFDFDLVLWSEGLI